LSHLAYWYVLNNLVWYHFLFVYASYFLYIYGLFLCIVFISISSSITCLLPIFLFWFVAILTVLLIISVFNLEKILCDFFLPIIFKPSDDCRWKIKWNKLLISKSGCHFTKNIIQHVFVYVLTFWLIVIALKWINHHMFTVFVV
jgi:hypothetical protein